MPLSRSFVIALVILATSLYSVEAVAKTKPVEFVFMERPPYAFNHDGRLTGVFPEIVEETLKEVSFPYRFISTENWLDILKMLKLRKNMCNVGSYRTQARLAYYRYSDAVLEESTYLIAANKAVAEKFGHQVSIETLKTSDFVLGYQSGFSYGELIDKELIHSDVKKVNLSFVLLSTGSVKERHIFSLLDLGRFDYAFFNPLEFYWNLSQFPDNKQNIVTLSIYPPVAVNPRYLMCNKNIADKVLNEFNQALHRVKRSPAFEAILAKYRQ